MLSYPCKRGTELPMTTANADEALPPLIIDKTAVLERFEGDADLLREIVQLFLEDYPGRLANMREALRRDDRDALQRAAHSIKGSVGNFNAEAAVAAALRLELMSPAGDAAHLGEACAALEREVARLATALANFA